MSGEVGVSVVAAVQDLNAQKLDAVNQAIDAASEQALSQKFDLSLTQMADASAINCEPMGEPCRKVVNVGQQLEISAGIPQAELRGPTQSSTIGDNMVSYLDGYSQRATNFTNEMNGTIEKMEGVTPSKPTAHGDITNSLDPASALRLMQHTFEFTVETYLISNASSLSTRIFNQLMREQ